jgi:3-hydroxyisobutyrate dehydrogenase
MRTGFLGLGAMGAPMARNLHKAGLLQGVWNRSAARAAELAAELACIHPATPADLAAGCEALVLCVSADADVLEVVRALAPGLKPGSLVIDCSTVSAATADAAGAIVAARGGAFLDCPVSGGVEGARQGTLAIMCGGDGPTFERARPVLGAMGKTLSLFGPIGAGQATKATNQIMCAGIIRAVAEAMAFARAQRLPLDKVVDTLGKGAGSSWYFVNRAPNMIRGGYPAGFRVSLHAKDLRICRDMAAACGVALPVVEDVLREYEELIRRGHGDEDISAIHRLKHELFEQAPFSNPPSEAIAALLRRARTIAMVGLSADPSRPSHGVARALQRFGYRVIPVTPGADSILGERCVPSLDRLGEVLGPDEQIDLVDVFRRPEHVAAIVEDCVRLGLPALWLQDGVVDAVAAGRARASGILTVMDRCIYRDRAALGA